MTDKSIEERVERLEKIVEKLPLSDETTSKAKKSGSLYGDPVFIVE